MKTIWCKYSLKHQRPLWIMTSTQISAETITLTKALKTKWLQRSSDKTEWMSRIYSMALTMSPNVSVETFSGLYFTGWTPWLWLSYQHGRTLPVHRTTFTEQQILTRTSAAEEIHRLNLTDMRIFTTWQQTTYQSESASKPAQQCRTADISSAVTLMDQHVYLT